MKWLHLMIIVLVSVVTLSATTINVPADAATIQAGIDATVDGDSVLVSNGTYIENLNFNGKNIVVYSEGGADLTTIDGGGLGSVVTFMSQEESAVLDGFTITNGRGILNDDNHFIGGGILCRYESTPTLRNLIVEGNFCTGDTSMGGGIMCSYLSDALIEDVIIRDNAADYGGGFVAYESSPTLQRVEIYENRGRTTGGGVALWDSSAYLKDVFIHHNEAEYLGAGLWVHDDATPVLNKVTIADNSCTSSIPTYRGGGGIELSDGASLKLVNSILWGNSPNQVEFYSRTGYADSRLDVDYSDIQSGELGIDRNGAGTLFYGSNNIMDNPLFEENYALSFSSPCIDAGTAQWIVDGVTVIDMVESDYCGPAPDMGACEMPLPPVTYYVPGDFSTIQAAIDGAVNSDIIMVEMGTYVENINYNGKSLTIKSMRGPELTTIDGNQSGSVVLFLSQEDENAVLDGFTITNGTGWDNGDEFVGGGIACRSSSSPTIKNLIVTGNSAFGGQDPAGGGITIAWDSNPSLENIEICYNESVWGGGLAIAYNSDPTLKNVEIYENYGSTTGGGVYIGVNAAPYFEDVYVHNNRATYYGGGFFLHDNVTPTFNKVTVRANRGSSGGGGLITNHGSKANIVNSIFYSNIPDQILFNNDIQYLPDTVSIAYSNIQNGLAGINVGQGLVNWLDGNISTDPLFIGASDELQASSPCVDTGIDYFVSEGVTLIDMAADEYVGVAPDMGAYESPEPSILNVPGDFASIQLAIEAAIDADTVLVAEGIYTENINFIGKNIVVKSVSGPELTTIDGGQNGSTVLMMSGEDESAILDGFTLTNGTGWSDGSVNLGGGICVRYSASPLLRNLIITENTATEANANDPSGGGISIGMGSNPILEDVIISNNESAWGGGISIGGSRSTPILRNVRLTGNYASITGGAGYIGDSSDPIFQSVTIDHNRARYYGGGIFVHEESKPLFNQVTFANNVGPSGGGGMIINDGSAPIVLNCIFWANLPDEIVLNEDNSYAPSTVTVDYSCVMNGLLGCDPGDGVITWGTHNISDNPGFVPESVYVLSDTSACIDAGTAYFAMDGETIIDMAEAEYLGDAPDLGSHESPYLTSIGDDLTLPQEFYLHQNFPNPFNPSTTIRFDLPYSGWVSLTIFDVRGREVSTLIDSDLNGGFHSLQWKAQDRGGAPLAAGIYLYEIRVVTEQGSEFRSIKKFSLLK